MVSCLRDSGGACPLASPPRSLSSVQLGGEPLRGSRPNPHSLALMLPAHKVTLGVLGTFHSGVPTQDAITVLQGLSPSTARSRQASCLLAASTSACTGCWTPGR